MARVDLFCVPQDRHRMILLADLLEKAGQSLRLLTEPAARPSDPLLVVCTAAALRHEWLAALLQADRQVVAIRLDNSPPPGHCAAVIDLQSWPARSADANDSISRLCRARSLQVAVAWAGVLNWRQRNRLDAEPCVARLLQRPGFEALRKALPVS